MKASIKINTISNNRFDKSDRLLMSINFYYLRI